MKKTPCIGTCSCGGRILVEDRGGCAEFRYEASCERCFECDPNGYATLGETRAQAPAYFKPTPRRAR